MARAVGAVGGAVGVAAALVGGVAVVGRLADAEHLGVPGTVGVRVVPAAEVLRLLGPPAAPGPPVLPVGGLPVRLRAPAVRWLPVRRLPVRPRGLPRGVLTVLLCVPGVPASSHPESSHAFERTVSRRSRSRTPGGKPGIAAEL
ncbi:hypothetical protein GCM10010420_04170 [Streptomyces glaucosporus]|uniref:Secreted protein n=1 Tax=Streptomyces glaucosporus TaxID=284044 RepID=A0ABP5UQG9_9ACTN